MGLPSIASIATAAAPPPPGAGGPAGTDTGGVDFASFFRGLSGPVKPAGRSDGGSSALSELESLLGGMLQQPPPALAMLFDRVQSALGAPPSAGTHASISSIAARIDALLGSGSTPAQIEGTVSQALTQAFAALSKSSGSSLDPAFVSRLKDSVASALARGGTNPEATVPATPAQASAPAMNSTATGPPGNGPPAEMAQALAQRIATVASAIAAGADTGETGQQFRNLASTLDPLGRGLPAPQPQTDGSLKPTVASSSSYAVTQSALRQPTLPGLAQGTGAPVRIDPQLTSLISVLALAHGGGGRQLRGASGAPSGPTTPTGALLGAVTGAQPATAPSNAAATTAGAPHSASTLSFDHYQVIDQVARALSVRPSDGTTTLRIHLVPENLGDVSVRLVVGPSGVSASFTAATPAAGAALQQGASQLGRAFAGHGLQLQQFSVNVGADPQGGFAYRQPQSSYTPFARHGGDGSFEDEDPLAAIPSFGPPATARPAGYLDYLV
ncbi:MAG TPA: flagellar hook-length control protein FliK [Candidatus Dormibacteraeota bacterium]|nr:flagellar hook-length control protein FliK [Candidatus Dormibacteraeota bacterium]